MSRRPLALLLVCLLTTSAWAQSDDEAKYTTDITKRANDVLMALKLEDSAKADRVRGIIMNQYRALRTWHDANDAKLKDKAATTENKDAVKATLKPLHDEFLAKLSAELTPEQVVQVKDKLTYNVVHVTYNAYCDQIPQLTDAQKAYIMAQLVEAREIAIDQGTSNEKHAVFGKYKGRINNYLSKEGYDLKKQEKEWAERRKARAATQASEKQAPGQEAK
jgi:hypothetical protein